MLNFESEFTLEADQRLNSADFYTRHFSELEIPPIEYVYEPEGKLLAYQIYGNLRAAKTAVAIIVPFSVRLSDESQQVRFSAAQTVLGPDYCVVGVQPYEPQYAKYNAKQLGKIVAGNYQPMADRILKIIENLNIRDDQELAIYGDSLGADIGIETSYLIHTDPNRGIRRLNKLGSNEFVRGQTHKLLGRLSVLLDFGKSGDDLFNNVVASQTAALLEARGIDLDDPDAKKKHDKAIKLDVTKYIKRDPVGCLAGFIGASTDMSVRQMNIVNSSGSEKPATFINRMDRSPICLPSFTEKLTPAENLTIEVQPGDHSTTNNIKRETALILQTVTV